MNTKGILEGKNIVVGVTGGIAVHKALDVVSSLRKKKANVFVVMTKNATEFVNTLPFQSLSSNYVTVDMFEKPQNWDIEHISLAQKADMFLIVPATANIIGKVRYGIADDMLSTTIMATKAPVVFSPAMNTNMYINPITQDNIESLKKYGYHFIEPASGMLACGDVGIGKLPAPATIVGEVEDFFKRTSELTGKKVLVTAGPTREPIDPVRYITNHSTGKMGYEIAKAAKLRGAEVILISGPTNLEKPKGIEVIDVETTSEMYDEVIKHFDNVDVVIKSAAVADYKPAVYSDKKIKKSDDDLKIELTRNKDILYELGQIKGNKLLVGFAAESNDIVENAKKKIDKKNLDIIVANNICQKDAGFGSDTNIVSIINKDGSIFNYDKMTKEEVAGEILNKVKDLL